MNKKIIMVVILMAALLVPLWTQTEANFRVTLTDDSQGAVITGYTGTVMAVRIPATIQGMPVREIGNRAFASSRITSVVIPQGVTIIREGAFYGCTQLNSVTFPSSLLQIEGSGQYGWGAFQNCTSLTSVTIPAGLTIIESGTFWGCTSLTSITIPAGIIAIEFWAFLDCTRLASVTFPQSLTEIGNGAFSGCTSLRSVTFPAGISAIGYGAFSNCTSLTTVTIPDTVSQITFGLGTVYMMNVFDGSNLNLASQAALRRRGYEGDF